MADTILGGSMRPLRKGEFRKNKDGSHSTELLMTEKIDGKWTNIPSLWMRGDKIVELSPSRAVSAARDYERRSKRRFPRFRSLSTAIGSAQARSSAGGISSGSLAR